MTASQMANLALLVLAVALGAIVLWPRRRREHRQWGLRPGRHTPLHYLTGIGLAVLTVGTAYVALLVTGVTTTSGGHPSGADIAAVVVYFVILALVEELVFRGLLLNALWELTGRATVAVVVTAALVAIPYLLVDGVTALSFTSAFLAGIMYGLAFLATGSVWTAAGMRTAWNITLGTVLGFTVSGQALTGSPIVEQQIDGPEWATGGSYGPEAGVAVIAARVGIIAILLVWLHDRSRGGLSS